MFVENNSMSQYEIYRVKRNICTEKSETLTHINLPIPSPEHNVPTITHIFE